MFKILGYFFADSGIWRISIFLTAYANNDLECGACERGGHIENCTPHLSRDTLLIAGYIRCNLIRLDGIPNVRCASYHTIVYDITAQYYKGI